MTACRLAVLGAALLVAGVVAAPSAQAAAPTITSISPTSGPLNTLVTAGGTNLAGATKATVGGVAAVITADTATAVTVRVPPTAQSGPVTVTTPAGTATSSQTFTVQPGVTSVPGTAPPGTTVTVSGSGFAPFEAVDVYLDTADVALATAGSTGAFSIGVAVPASATPGTHWLSAVGRHSGYAAQHALLVRSDWPMLGYSPAQQDANPRENTLTLGNVSGLEQNWVGLAGGPAESAVSEVGGLDYGTSANGAVYALNATTGTYTWSRSFTSTVFHGTPAVVGGVVYVASADGTMYALTATTGATLWTASLGGTVDYSSAVVSGGVVLIGTSAGVVALNASGGSVLWHFASGNADTTPAVADGTVYAGSDDSHVYAINIGTGAQVWSFSTQGAVRGGIAVSSGRVFFADGSLGYALNARTGQLVWSETFPLGVNALPAVGGGLVFYGLRNGVIAERISDGTFAWSTALPSISAPAFGDVVLANGVIYAGFNDGEVYALSAATGVEYWSAQTRAASSSHAAGVDGVVVDNGAVTVSSDSGRIYRYTLGGANPGVARPAVRGLHP